ncbi:MAG: protoheme IX farnesyltransferase [Ignavibacteriota bacterium]|nr:MAG: protoheme IX farnesyltransferase [Ignavibacterium sp.]MBL1154566.1 protoheme IX farnesyltransferase [Ignavibacteriota bacterium]MCO6447484.1 protoheme IX farnesyltransferase [Ignavibacterium album]MDX9711927.1 protoheme IX farnesyltransferase [Ignavibacteriaceae bacterium]MEB2354501.1 protoheme IX farnesyltransferase [Ignavibacteriales bacterium]
MLNQVKIITELTKLSITIFVTVTTAFGYIAYSGVLNSKMILPTIGILFLACGSAAINHYQERNTDSLMERTKKRPIPSGKIKASTVLFMAVFLAVSGSVMLFFGGGLLAMLLGILNLIWYNIIYTPLKKKTPFAIIPGSIVGALPPMVGWVSAGGYVFNPQILLIAIFFFIWQIPHFWLLLLLLDKDYQKAGFPTLTQIFNQQQLGRITFIWIIATAVTGLLLPLFRISQNGYINLSLLLAAIWLSYKSFSLIRNTVERTSYKFAFKGINYFALFVVLMVSIDKLLS